MTPFVPAGNIPGQYGLGDNRKAYILYNGAGVPAELDLSASAGKYSLEVIDPKSGEVLKEGRINGGRTVKINKTGTGDEVITIIKL
jgi:hypothetical protein